MMEPALGSRKETWVAEPGGRGTFECVPLCTTGILRTVNESPIHKNKEITISVGGPLFPSNRRLFNQGGETLARGPKVQF